MPGGQPASPTVVTHHAMTPRRSTFTLDLLTAYGASIARLGSWAAITAMLYRYWGDELVAIFAFIRATIGLLAYVTLGIGPAMIHHLAHAVVRSTGSLRDKPATDDPQPAAPWVDPAPASRPTLDYYAPPKREWTWIRPADPISTIYANGLLIAMIAAIVGSFAVFLYADGFQAAYQQIDPFWLPVATAWVFGIGIGTVARLASDVPGALLQAKGWMAFDNLLLIAAEVTWVTIAWNDASHTRASLRNGVFAVGSGYAISGILLFLSRYAAAAIANGLWPRRAPVSLATMKPLLLFGGAVTLAQLADFLYAPIDFILINRLLDPTAAAAYLPAIQIDAGLLLLVTGMAAVLLPRAALAHAGNDATLLRTYYIRGTLASTLVLIVAAALVWALSPTIFRLWLGDDAPATRAILPLLLIHTVAGGSSAVGRAILLGMGRVKAFTIAALLAGVVNVVLSYCFVRYLNLGLHGIVLGTIIAVVGRCLIWQPWYVMRCLRR
jgi:O-antigen/teichoic acid export membrane protein